MLVPARWLLTFVLGASVGAVVLAQPDMGFPPLEPETAAGWRQYAWLTGQRIDRELKSPQGFLALDFAATAGAERQAVLSGQMPIASMLSVRADGRSADVPGGWVHHWRGAVLIRGARLDEVFQRLQEEVPGTGKGDVIASQILARDGPHLRVSIKLQRRGRFIVAYNLVYNTEHDVTLRRLTSMRGSSTSVATKIAELYHPGTADEREFGPGEDNRFLQRWNSYWRYEEVPAGVIAECESITLSRRAPAGFGWARSLVDGTAKESMERALVNLRRHFATTA